MPRERVNGLDREIGARIVARRKTLRVTQTDLAKAVGVSAQQISVYETGRNRITTILLLRIAKALDTTIVNFTKNLEV